MSHVNWILISVGIVLLIGIIIICVLIYRKKLYKKVATTDDLSYMRLEDNSALTLLATPATTKGNERNSNNISKPIKNIDFENEYAYEMTSNKLITKGQKKDNLKPEIIPNNSDNNSKRVRWSKLVNNNKKRASNVERITNDTAKYGEDSPAMSLFSKLNKSEGIVKLKSNINFYNNNGNKNNNNNNNDNILLEYEPNNSDNDVKSDDDMNEIDKPNTMQF